MVLVIHQDPLDDRVDLMTTLSAIHLYRDVSGPGKSLTKIGPRIRDRQVKLIYDSSVSSSCSPLGILL